MQARRYAARELLRLGAFFTRLAVKRLLPQLPVRPLVAELFVTENCNLACISCACWRITTRHELTTDEWKDVVEQLAQLRFLQCNFTGGEPLVRRDAAEIIAHARDRGIPHLHLNTNGILLDADRLDEVIAAGVRSFNVSVDGSDGATHDAIRGVPGAFDTTMTNVRRLLDAREPNELAVRMNFTVLRSNIDNLPQIMRLAQQMGVSLYLNLSTDHTFLFRDGQVTIEAAVPRSRIDAVLDEAETIVRRDPRFLPRFSDLAYIRRHFDDVVQRRLPCAESQLKLMIHSRGDVGGCWAHDPTDNVRDRPISEIICDPRYRREHAKFFRKDCVGCGSNYSLNLRWLPHTYAADYAFRHGLRRLSSTPSR